jgi:hypothetical protein
MNLQLNLISSMYVHQGAPPSSRYSLWYAFSEYHYDALGLLIPQVPCR